MAPKTHHWFVYMVRCKDGSLYTGITTDLKKRLKAHNDGKGGRYTASHRPVALVFKEKLGDRSSALRREAEIKKWRKGKKELLVR